MRRLEVENAYRNVEVCALLGKIREVKSEAQILGKSSLQFV
jgi:hypothetical protein